jgi:hypothetical protein
MSAPWAVNLDHFYSVFFVDKFFGAIDKINFKNNKFLYNQSII